ncbi:glycosyltransferase family 9 protein [Helicobacter bizzozeronii]|uniref:glycosyltransferase family 9 protein n=1 Tax=Helicobacter bizzozeronii TaxID=56877 RepID=UPI0025525205|nr:glycosyltransferase family 9 protein [Helicobacter bizzozeronii]
MDRHPSILAHLRLHLRLWAERISYSLASLMVWVLRKIQKQPIRPKTLLLMKLDTIGDYVLFRNFLQPLREFYAGYEITLLCNKDFLEVIDAYDRPYIDHLILLDTPKWGSWKRFPLFYRLKTTYALNQKSYEVVLNPIFHRSIYRDDFLVGLINAQHKIAHLGFEQVYQWHANTPHPGPLDHVYTRFINNSPEVLFEFERNKEFFSQLLQQPLNQVRLELPPPPPLSAQARFTLPTQDYGVFFLGARDSKRKWALDSWMALAQKINPAFQIVLCGSPNESSEGLQLAQKIPNALNLAGKTSLMELLSVLCQARFVVSNETAIPHFCVALGLGPIFVISNGNTFKRFAPYPPSMHANHHVIYHPKIDALLQTPDGFGRCVEIYKYAGIDLQIPHPNFPQMVADKMAEVDAGFVKHTP